MSFLNVITKSYHGVSIIIRRYWSQYGGMSVLLSSVYLHFSLFLTMILYPFWAKNHWTDMALHIIPFFIIISCMTLLMWIYFRKQFILHFKNNDIYIRLSANFTHFAVVQVVALFSTLIVKTINLVMNNNYSILLNALGFSVFLYASSLIFAIIFGMFRISLWDTALKTVKR